MQLRKIFVLVLVMLIFSVTACSSKSESSENNNSSEQKADSTPAPAVTKVPELPAVTDIEPEPDEPVTPVPAEGNVLLRIAVSGDVEKINRNQEKINNKIHEHGLDVNVFFYEVDAFKTDSLKEILSAGDPYDIITTGLWPDHIGDAKFVSSGLFYDFSDYLESDSGKKLKEVFTDNEWNSAKIGDAVYNFPAYTALHSVDVNVNMCENKTFDKTIEGILNACRNSEIEGRNRLFIGKGYNIIFNMANLTECLPAPFNVSEEKFVNPFKYEALLKIREVIAEEKITKDNSTDPEKEIYLEDNISDRNDVYAAVTNQSVTGELETSKTLLMPHYSPHSNAGSFGISEKSENKEKALEFMYLVYTDRELADMLVYECSAEYENGTVANIEVDMRGTIWGIGAFASPLKNENVKDRRQTILETEKEFCWDYAGFIADLTDEERETLKNCESEWMEWTVDVDKEIPPKELIDSLDLIIDKLNAQFLRSGKSNRK